jgi:drug/metabolite transporter (DMT)-like permease
VSVSLALSAALLFGVGDFLGGLATRRAAALPVALLAQVAGLVALLAVLPLLETADPTRGDLAWGAVAGMFGGVGLTLMFRSFALGAMGVAAPVTALCAAGVPVVTGLALGERPGVAALVGVGLAMVAVALISREEAAAKARALAPLRTVVGTALVAGVAFGIFFTLLGQTGDDAGLWPLVAARSASGLLLLGPVLRTRGLPVATVAWTACLSGVVDMGANVLYVLATRRGLLSVVAVLTSLYPATTVVLARYVLREPVGRVQLVGFAVAAVAVALIALD